MNISQVGLNNVYAAKNLSFGRKIDLNSNHVLFDENATPDVFERTEANLFLSPSEQDCTDVSTKEWTNALIIRPEAAIRLFEENGFPSLLFVDQQDNKTVCMSLRDFDKFKKLLLDFGAENVDDKSKESVSFEQLEGLELDELLFRIKSNLTKRMCNNPSEISSEKFKTLRALDAEITKKIYEYTSSKDKINRLGAKLFTSFDDYPSRASRTSVEQKDGILARFKNWVKGIID